MNKTKIPWCDYTWNPITGCTPISDGCRHCYAAAIARRFWKGRKFSDIQFHPERLGEISKIRKPSRIFVGSMGDMFHDPTLFWHVAKVIQEIWKYPQHTFIFLTKRPHHMHRFFSGCRIPDNVWLGVTVENQFAADRISYLCMTPAKVKFISCEPLLGRVELNLCISCMNGIRNEHRFCYKHRGVNWVIAGSETGPGARPCNPEWFGYLYQECEDAMIPYFWKQGDCNNDLKVRKFPGERMESTIPMAGRRGGNDRQPE